MAGVSLRLYIAALDALEHGDQTIELRPRDLMAVVRERYALVDAMWRIEYHHEEINARALRAEEESHTLRLVREALAAVGEEHDVLRRD